MSQKEDFDHLAEDYTKVASEANESQIKRQVQFIAFKKINPIARFFQNLQMTAICSNCSAFASHSTA